MSLRIRSWEDSTRDQMCTSGSGGRKGAPPTLYCHIHLPEPNLVTCSSCKIQPSAQLRAGNMWKPFLFTAFLLRSKLDSGNLSSWQSIHNALNKLSSSCMLSMDRLYQEWNKELLYRDSIPSVLTCTMWRQNKTLINLRENKTWHLEQVLNDNSIWRK